MFKIINDPIIMIGVFMGYEEKNLSVSLEIGIAQRKIARYFLMFPTPIVKYHQRIGTANTKPGMMKICDRNLMIGHAVLLHSALVYSVFH